MTAQISFYFDMVSPFSYLAHLKLPALSAKYGYRIAYHPMEIAAAKTAAGNYGPPNREVPAKMKVMVQDMRRWAARYQAPLVLPVNFECGRWNIGALFACAHGDRVAAFVSEAWARIYGRGIDPTDDNELRAASAASGLDAEAMIAYIDSAAGRAAFNAACDAAHRRGVFGAPMMIIGDEVWWGNDRLDFLEEYLAAHPQ